MQLFRGLGNFWLGQRHFAQEFKSRSAATSVWRWGSKHHGAILSLHILEPLTSFDGVNVRHVLDLAGGYQTTLSFKPLYGLEFFGIHFVLLGIGHELSISCWQSPA